ncbi:MAG: hypothetical protein PHG82_02495 [Candidatus Gracilibacteria bacterium]|nr:hypothetical protein [Candidatus Gracilibacteria bacterium]
MKKNNSGYSVVLALLMTSFILILVAGVFKLILENMYDTRGMQDYLKAYSRAEGSMELALKKIKDNNFGYEEHIFPGLGTKKISEIFTDNNKTLIGYDINSTSVSIIGKGLDANSYAIYPLLSVKKPRFEIKTGDGNTLVWNIIGDNGGISGTGSFDSSLSKENKNINSSNNFVYTTDTIEHFLIGSTANYLILYNVGNTPINYDLKSDNLGEKFATENINIVATGKLGSYKQNLNVDLNIANNLNLLKYSILSPEN